MATTITITVMIMVMDIPMVMARKRARKTVAREGMARSELCRSDMPMADGSGAGIGNAMECATAGLDPRLLLWLSPSFPVGAFAFSHGLEQAAARGWLPDSNALQEWICDLIRYGSLHNDLVLMAAAWGAASLGEYANLREINELALALQPSAERRLETVTQGNSFIATMLMAWPCERLRSVRDALTDISLSYRGTEKGISSDVAYPVAVAAACAAHGVRLEAALSGHACAFAGNLVSASIRLSVVGQTDGQRVLAALMPTLIEAADAASRSTLDELGGFALRSDIAQSSHETQYSRLFRS